VRTCSKRFASFQDKAAKKGTACGAVRFPRMPATKAQIGDCGVLTLGGKVEDWTAAAPPAQAEKSRARAAEQLERGKSSGLHIGIWSTTIGETRRQFRRRSERF
jgi:uncharacterized cupin superfamily protein